MRQLTYVTPLLESVLSKVTSASAESTPPAAEKADEGLKVVV